MKKEDLDLGIPEADVNAGNAPTQMEQTPRSTYGCELCGKWKRRRFYVTHDRKTVCGHCLGRRLGGRPT